MLSAPTSRVRPPNARPLAAPGAILLVSCYELGHQPLSLAAPLAVLRAGGFRPAAVDTAVEALTEEAIRAARLVAIAVPMHTALRLGTRVAERVRAINPAAHVCFYGLYATLNADHLLRHHGDSVIGGEYEGQLLALAREIDDGVWVAGRGTQGAPRVAGTEERLPPATRHPLPVVPDRRGLPPLRRYAGLERAGTIVPAGYVEATRGCRHLCRHCPIPPIYGGRFVVVPRDVVVADARAQVEAGARHITFGDPDFFNGPSHGLRIMRALREEYPWLSFDVTVKVQHLLEHRRRVPELAALGCAFVVSAVESLSGLVLEKLAKGHTRADVEAALAVLDAVGLPIRPSLLPFSPWTTLDDYLELLAFVAERDLIECVDPIQLAIRLLVPPGSSLLADPTSAEWLGPLDAANFTYRWDHPDPRLDALHRDVTALVEAAARDHESARITFARIWEAAHGVASVDPPPVPAPVIARPRPPRLTESWFC